MKIVFVSNYYNHHQHAVSQALNRLCGGDFAFISTSEMRRDRRALGYGQWEIPDYVHTSYTGEADARACRARIAQADVVIAGAAPEEMIRPAIAEGKLVLLYRERPLKQKTVSLRQRLHFLKTRLTCGTRKNVWLLCAGAYTAGDYLTRGCFPGRACQWGYFPETRHYAVSTLLAGKQQASILWAGRFLPWKHPDDAVLAARGLRRAGYDFTMSFIGTGEMEARLREMIREYGLEDCVHLLGAMKPEQVRGHMEKSSIFLATSDRQEGWGAVVNEAMNSGCAVVASHAIGAVPCLIEDGENGLIYRSGDVDMLCGKVRHLLDHPQQCSALGRSAYATLTQLWNAETAADRLYALASRLLSGEQGPAPYETGPCSPAPVLSDDWK